MTTATDFARSARINTPSAWDRFAHIAKVTNERGGGTFTMDGDIQGTYLVVGGLVPTTIVPQSLFSEHDVHAFVEAHNPTAFGTWVNDGKVYIDAVTLLTDREEAYTLGKERGEIAIYDLEAGEEILIDYLTV